MGNATLIWLLITSLLAVGFGITCALLYKRSLRLEKLVENTTDKLQHLQLHFERFAPPNVVENLTLGSAMLKPNRRAVTVLFADLKGFTGMCEQMEPEDTVTILNGYFQAMNKVIKEHHGRVTELLGDGMLALFGALESNPWQARDAVNGALSMRAALVEYNASLRERQLPELTIGIGIHRGEVQAGVMGNADLSKFAVVGDVVNTASRVESLTRTMEVDLLVTDEVKQELDANYHLREMPPASVKGKALPLITYHVEGYVDAKYEGSL